MEVAAATAAAAPAAATAAATVTAAAAEADTAAASSSSSSNNSSKITILEVAWHASITQYVIPEMAEVPMTSAMVQYPIVPMWHQQPRESMIVNHRLGHARDYATPMPVSGSPVPLRHPSPPRKAMPGMIQCQAFHVVTMMRSLA